jgi:hypothetical protein
MNAISIRRKIDHRFVQVIKILIFIEPPRAITRTISAP